MRQQESLKTAHVDTDTEATSTMKGPKASCASLATACTKYCFDGQHRGCITIYEALSQQPYMHNSYLSMTCMVDHGEGPS